MSEERNPLIRSNQSIAELNCVPGFNPAKLLLQILTEQKLKGAAQMQMTLKIKKLWFRRAYPHGRVRVTALEVTEQLARIQAEIYLDRADSTPVANFIGSRTAENSPGGLFLQAAEFEAIDNALTDAGFGIQLCDVAETYGEEAYVPPMTGIGREEAGRAEMESVTSGPEASASDGSTQDKPESSQNGQVQNQDRVDVVQKDIQPAGFAPQRAYDTAAPTGHTEAGGNEQRNNSGGETSVVKHELEQHVETRTKQNDGDISGVGKPQGMIGAEGTHTVSSVHGEEPHDPVPSETQQGPAGTGNSSTLPGGTATAAENRGELPNSAFSETQETSSGQSQTISGQTDGSEDGELTLEQALQTVADVGSFRGKTLAEIADQRPTTLRWFFTTCPSSSEQLKKAARMVFESLNQPKVA